MKYKIIASTMMLLALMMTGCVDEEPDAIVTGVPYEFVQPEPNQEYINNTIEMWSGAERIEYLQTGEVLKINGDEYEDYFPHTIILIPDNIEQRVITCDYKLCNQDPSILIGENPCNYTDKSRVLLFLSYENAWTLYSDDYNCPNLWMKDQAGVVEFNNIYICNIEMVSVLRDRDFDGIDTVE